MKRRVAPGEHGSILLDERVAGLEQDACQFLFAEHAQGAEDRKASDELGDEAIVDEIPLLSLQHGVRVALGDRGRCVGRLQCRANWVPKAYAAGGQPLGNQLVQPDKRPTTNEQDVRGIDRNELSSGILPSSFFWNVHDRTLEHPQQRLLNALATHIAGDAHRVRLAGDFINFVNIHDSVLGSRRIIPRCLIQLVQNTLHILSDVPRLGQRRGIRHRERDVHQPRQGLCQQRLAATRRPKDQDVGFFNLDTIELILAGFVTRQTASNG
mmetsp:Transcript_14655/g.41790  ORF Transcript_14655/g.41790 Transcript_14655/m.41790 type:complete len:268 (+) Transcript_14655:1325-2128(+)